MTVTSKFFTCGLFNTAQLNAKYSGQIRIKKSKSQIDIYNSYMLETTIQFLFNVKSAHYVLVGSFGELATEYTEPIAKESE